MSYVNFMLDSAKLHWPKMLGFRPYISLAELRDQRAESFSRTLCPERPACPWPKRRAQADNVGTREIFSVRAIAANQFQMLQCWCAPVSLWSDSYKSALRLSESRHVSTIPEVGGLIGSCVDKIAEALGSSRPQRIEQPPSRSDG